MKYTRDNIVGLKIKLIGGAVFDIHEVDGDTVYYTLWTADCPDDPIDYHYNLTNVLSDANDEETTIINDTIQQTYEIY